MKTCSRWIYAALLLLCTIQCAAANAPDRHDPKILVLIIANDDNNVYSELHKLWRSYMHLDPEHIEAYFIKADPMLSSAFKIDGDVLWTKTVESFFPGILNKTILSLEAMLPRIKTEFDYVLRTNLSSFYIFPRLLKFLETLPKEDCYCGLIGENWLPLRYAAGSGFILSPDLVERMVKEKEKLFDCRWPPDDVAIGQFFQDRGVNIIPAPRLDIYSLSTWREHRYIFTASSEHPRKTWLGEIPEEVFHFRVKHSDGKLRMAEDIPVYGELIKMFYGPFQEN